MIDLKAGIEKGKIQKESDEIEYFYLHEHYQHYERGTVFIGDRTIFGYPHIRRIFVIKEGIKRNIKSKFVYLEEKIDGFNLRIANIDSKVYAFSRGGHLDYFSTEKTRHNREILSFLSDNPEYVLCAEMVGNTPHTKPTKKFDTKLFVFDIMREDGSLLPCEEKYELLDNYKINQVPRLGKVASSDIKKISSIVILVHKQNAEGIVIRGTLGETVKHVNANSDIADISECSLRYFDMPSGFFHQRIMRAAFFANEFGLNKVELSKKLGNAFLNSLTPSIKKAKNAKSSFEEFEILISSLSLWQKIKRQMGNEILVEEIWRKNEGKNIRLRFKKIYRKTSSLLHSFSSGKAIED